ncbi:MAG: hypothetical protein U0Q15_03850 [Kineosporiaceae bacterium]
MMQSRPDDTLTPYVTAPTPSDPRETAADDAAELPVPTVTGGTFPVRRYVAKLAPAGGWQESSAFDARVKANQTTSQKNVGWIRLRHPAVKGAAIPYKVHHAGSQRGEFHTEEQLLRWAAAEGAHFDATPTGDDSPEKWRVLDMYTERKPCDQTWAEKQQKKWDSTDGKEGDPRRSRAPGSCHALLSETLHAATTVYHSVENYPVPHEELLVRQRFARFTKEQCARVTDALDAATRTYGREPKIFSNVALKDAVTVAWHSWLFHKDFTSHAERVRARADAAIAALDSWSLQYRRVVQEAEYQASHLDAHPDAFGDVPWAGPADPDFSQYRADLVKAADEAVIRVARTAQGRRIALASGGKPPGAALPGMLALRAVACITPLTEAALADFRSRVADVADKAVAALATLAAAK